MGGQYRVEFWDAETGAKFQTATLKADETTLTIDLPDRADSFAVKADRVNAQPPQLNK